MLFNEQGKVQRPSRRVTGYNKFARSFCCYNYQLFQWVPTKRIKQIESKCHGSNSLVMMREVFFSLDLTSNNQICVFFWLTFEIHNEAAWDCLIHLVRLGSKPAWHRGHVCQSVQDGAQSLKWPSIRDKYPWDIVKLVVLKNDLNGMCSVDAIMCDSCSAWAHGNNSQKPLLNTKVFMKDR